MYLLLYIHAVDHLAHGVLQADRILFKLEHLLIKVLGENESLRHIVAHGGNADGVHLLLVGLTLALIARKIRAVDIGWNLVHGNAGIHNARLDSLDEALHGQGHGVRAVAELHRSIPHLLEDGLRAAQGVAPEVQQRLDHVVQVSVPHIAHADRSIYRRNHHYIVGSIDAGVDGARREHGLNDHHETPPVIGLGRHLEVEIGGNDHPGERIMQLVGLFIVDGMHHQPDAVQIHGGDKVAQEGDDLHHLRRVRGHLGQLDRGFQFRRRG